MLVSLLSNHELTSLGLSNLPTQVVAHGLRWSQNPIRVGDGPATQLRGIATSIHGLLASGQGVVVSDRTGHGRSGMVAAAVLVMAGLSAERAIEIVRAAVPGAVEPGRQTGAVVDLSLALRLEKQKADGPPELASILPTRNTRGFLFCPDDPSKIFFRVRSTWDSVVRAASLSGALGEEMEGVGIGFVTTADGTWLLGPEGALSWPSNVSIRVPTRLEVRHSAIGGEPALWISTPEFIAFMPQTDGRQELVVLDRPPGRYRTIHDLFETMARPTGPAIRIDMDIGGPVRLVTAGGEAYLAIGVTGAGLVGYSLSERQPFYIGSPLPEGHPEWVAGHPSLPLVALCSGRLEILDLARRERVFHLQFDDQPKTKLCGEFSPDGEHFVFVSGQGVLALQVSDFSIRRILPISEAGEFHCEQPVRFTPDGRFLLVPCRAGVAVYHASILAS